MNSTAPRINQTGNGDPPPKTQQKVPTKTPKK